MDSLEWKNGLVIFQVLGTENIIFSQLDRLLRQQMLTLDTNDLAQNAKGDKNHHYKMYKYNRHCKMKYDAALLAF